MSPPLESIFAVPPPPFILCGVALGMATLIATQVRTVVRTAPGNRLLQIIVTGTLVASISAGALCLIVAILPESEDTSLLHNLWRSAKILLLYPFLIAIVWTVGYAWLPRHT